MINTIPDNFDGVVDSSPRGTQPRCGIDFLPGSFWIIWCQVVVFLGTWVEFVLPDEIVNSMNSTVRHAHSDRIATDGMLAHPHVWPTTI